MVQQRPSCVQRSQKVLEDANIKLSSVASDLAGKSGWDILCRLIEGQADAKEMADLARGRLKSKKEQLIPALEGLSLAKTHPSMKTACCYRV